MQGHWESRMADEITLTVLVEDMEQLRRILEDSRVQSVAGEMYALPALKRWLQEIEAALPEES